MPRFNRPIKRMSIPQRKRYERRGNRHKSESVPYPPQKELMTYEKHSPQTH